MISPEWADELVENYRNSLEQGRVVSRPVVCAIKHPYTVDWRPFKRVEWRHPADTHLSLERFETLAKRMLHLPEGFKLHSRVEKIWTERKRMASGDQLIDWGFAENLAYASLLTEGYSVRLSGQDTGRGTFFPPPCGSSRSRQWRAVCSAATFTGGSVQFYRHRFAALRRGGLGL